MSPQNADPDGRGRPTTPEPGGAAPAKKTAAKKTAAKKAPAKKAPAKKAPAKKAATKATAKKAPARKTAAKKAPAKKTAAKKTAKKATAKKAPARKKASTRKSTRDARCIALVSPEPFFLTDGLQKIEKSLFGDQATTPSITEANLKVKPGEDVVELRTVLDDIRTTSLFGGRKLMVIRGAESLDGDARDALMNTLEHIPAAVTVVLLMEKLRKNSKLEKLIDSVGVIERFKTMYDRPGPWQKGTPDHDNEVSHWVVKRAAEHGLTVSLVDAFVLVQRIGNHPARLNSEIDKLSILHEPGATVARRTIEALAPDAQEFKAFDLSDAVVEKNRRRALDILDIMLRDGMVGADQNRLMFTGAIGSIVIGALRSKIVQLLKARTMLDAGRNPNDIWTELRVPPFLRDSVGRQARARTAADLRECLRQLLKFDLEMKGGSPFPEATMTRMVIALT